MQRQLRISSLCGRRRHTIQSRQQITSNVILQVLLAFAKSMSACMSATNSSMCRFIYYFQKGVRHCWTMLDPAIECKWMQITFTIIYIHLFDKCWIGIKLGSFCRLWVAKQLSQTQGRKFKALNENSIVALFGALSSPARIRESWGNGQWNHKIKAWGHKYGVLDNGLASWYSNKIAAAKKETWMEQKLRIYRTLVLQFGTIFLPQNGHSL